MAGVQNNPVRKLAVEQGSLSLKRPTFEKCRLFTEDRIIYDISRFLYLNQYFSMMVGVRLFPKQFFGYLPNCVNML